jgi:hypothetical protein
MLAARFAAQCLKGAALMGRVAVYLSRKKILRVIRKTALGRFVDERAATLHHSFKK